MSRLVFLLSAFALGGHVAWSAPRAPSPSPSPTKPSLNFNYARAAELAERAAPLVEAQDQFGSRLLERLERQNTRHANVLCSPTSLWQALALAQTGARGQTKTELQGLLSLQHLPDAQLGAGNRAFNELLQEQKGAAIFVANSAWFADDFKPAPSFVRSAQNDFGAGVESFARANPANTARRINDWVSLHTQKEIPHIVQANDVADSAAILVNAVYFRGGWKFKFNKDLTKPAPFHLSDQTTVQVPMMSATRDNAFLSGQSFDGARLPYENTNCALWVLLPKEGKTPLDVTRELGHKETQHLTGSETVELLLPRFEVNWSGTLQTDLAAMNAPLPFRSAADFSAMGQPVGPIGSVLHVCKMRVDEEGTVAAAATAVGMRATMARPTPHEPRKLVVNRPFVVALVEETSGARLFEGVVYNPNAK